MDRNTNLEDVSSLSAIDFTLYWDWQGDAYSVFAEEISFGPVDIRNSLAEAI